jgi:hypothetical protein
MILSNEWWQAVWDTYNYSILGFPVVLTFALKVIAIYHPMIQSDKIVDLLKEYWPKGTTS